MSVYEPHGKAKVESVWIGRSVHWQLSFCLSSSADPQVRWILSANTETLFCYFWIARPMRHYLERWEYRHMRFESKISQSTIILYLQARVIYLLWNIWWRHVSNLKLKVALMKMQSGFVILCNLMCNRL